VKILSLNIGQIGSLNHAGQTISSAFVKQPVEGRLELTPTGFAADHQADLKNHGGPDKAVCVYPHEHYTHFGEMVGKQLEFAAFGENFTTLGLLESEVCIGDIYTISSATVQVSQPRQPCFKLGARHGEPQLPLWVQESGLTGFYFRVLQVGAVQAGDGFVLRSRGRITLAEANRVMHRDKQDLGAVQALLAEPALSASWQRSLGRRLASALEGTAENTAPRLKGSEV
jgi:MOSC domain-containing protein YiiM